MDPDIRLWQEDLQPNAAYSALPARPSSAPPTANEVGPGAGDSIRLSEAEEQSKLDPAPASWHANSTLCYGYCAATQGVDATAANLFEPVPCMTQPRCLDQSGVHASLQWYRGSYTVDAPTAHTHNGPGTNLANSLGLGAGTTTEDANRKLTPALGPALPVHTNVLGHDGHATLALSSCFCGGHNEFQYQLGATEGLFAVQHDRQAVGPQECISSRVQKMELSTPSSLSPRTPFQGQAVKTSTTSAAIQLRPEWERLSTVAVADHLGIWHSGSPEERNKSGTSGHSSTAMVEGQDLNPMWGPGQHGPSARNGFMWNDAAILGHRYPSIPGEIGGSISVSSSQSLPDLTWASSEPMLYCDCTGSSRNELASGAQHHHGPEHPGSEWVRRNPCLLAIDSPAASRSSLQAEADGGRVEVNSVWTSVGVAGMLSEASGGNRMEEGSIGSKRRIWYRAPNGQFASASAGRQGKEDGEESLSGEGSSRGSETIRRIRRRRKSEEVDRKYRCDFDGCDKAYGTLNHLNTHRATNEHGPRLNAVAYRKAHAEWAQRQCAKLDSELAESNP